MLRPLPPLSRFGRICSEWLVLEMPHSLHLVQQCTLPKEIFFFNILLLISDSMINYNFAPVHAEATKKATFCNEIKSFWCEFLMRQCCTSHTSMTYFWESIPSKGWGKFQVSPKWFTQVLGTLVNLSRQVQDVESAASEHYKIYMHCSIQSTDAQSFKTNYCNSYNNHFQQRTVQKMKMS